MTMACLTMDPTTSWIDDVERRLFALACELKRLPLDPSTKRLHLRALELKRAIVPWRDHPPRPDAVSAVADEIQDLLDQCRVLQHRRPHRLDPRRAAFGKLEYPLREVRMGDLRPPEQSPLEFGVLAAPRRDEHELGTPHEQEARRAHAHSPRLQQHAR